MLRPIAALSPEECVLSSLEAGIRRVNARLLKQIYA